MLPDSRPHPVARLTCAFPVGSPLPRLTFPSPRPACGVRHGSVQTYPPPLEIPELQNLHTPPEPQASKSISSTARLPIAIRIETSANFIPPHYEYHASSQIDISRDKIQHSVQLHHVTKNSIAPEVRPEEEYSTKAKAVKTQG